jgi:hypothetical protein
VPLTCPPKRDPIVIFGLKEKNYGQEAIYTRTNNRKTPGSRSSAEPG